MYTCRKATELIEQESFESFSRLTRFRLRMHLLMCDACKKYQQQSKKISHWIKNKKNATLDESSLSEVSKIEMIKKIKKKYKEL